MNPSRLALILAVAPALYVSATAALPEKPPDAKVAAIVKEMEPALIAMRRDLHARPELSRQETRTAAFVAAEFRRLGLEVREGIGGTGVAGILRGGKPGPLIALRGDMDALPITEETGLPFASKEKALLNGREVGIMHACGHDIHTTALIGTARALSRMKADLRGTVLFIAQPSEETGPGAKGMLEDGLFRDGKPEAVFSLHVDDTLPAGKIGYAPGWYAANVDTFSLVVESEGCHGANPQLCVDPIVVGAQIVVALQVMISRELDVHKDTVVTVGSFHAGAASNIIPTRAELSATVRTYGDEQRALVRERVTRLIKGTCEAAGAKYVFNYWIGTPALYNDPALTAEALATARRVLGGSEFTFLQLPDMGGEDFSYFARETPAFMFGLGVKPKEGPSSPVHSATFVADENAVALGVRLLATMVLDYSASHAGKSAGQKTR